MQIPAHHAATLPFTAAAMSAPATAVKSSAASSSSSSDDSSTSSTSSASITANDFLELLVTEMKNQDPTADTDPNEYIDQLVQVNSLEQLIQINQDLGGGSAASGSPNTSSVSHGNLSSNIPNHTQFQAAANQVADALEDQQHTSTQNAVLPYDRQFPAASLQNFNLQ
jgi:flagellar basal-body rod modification protein FlgD